MKENQVNSVEEYLNYLKRYNKYGTSGNLYFRGQLSRFPDMKPSVARKKEYLKNEIEFYKENSVANKSIIQNLAKMQHDGIPTRLLDFTIDPLVALFFATQESLREDSSIYIFIRPNIDANSLEVEFSSFIATQKDKDLSIIVKKFNDGFHRSLSLSQAKEIISKGLFIQPSTVVDIENKRMLKQKGTFAIPGNTVKNNKIIGMIPFENDGSYEEIVVPFECHEEIREELEKRGYTRMELLGECDEEIRYIGIDKDTIQRVDPKTTKFRGYQTKYSVTIITNTLLTYDEMQKLGYKIALNSKAEVVWIWFRRDNASTGNNIVTQQWFKREQRLFFNNVGKEYGELVLSEERQDGYVCKAYYSSHPNILSKHLTVSENAVVVDLDIKKSPESLILCTNLLKGTRLFLTYKINNGKERSIEVTVQGMRTNIPIEYQPEEKISGDITLIVSTLQDKNIRDKYGIDYENLTGRFIHRSEEDSMVYGRKHFLLK
ncbi:FRG domain-containing protein [Limosilactobacillus reuteri]|uniref:FRG domain-containing protein n=1 Tax=Limosilactobacillus reuteri TaxID=1598 RepID=UPI001E3C207A|nr:FRG domain-containing protein [Limosilactobacillus reuteri]MCC4397031.1 FRG domain-containing protein [Limosilactobacillus reuteri]MCC4409340.1 FRG domain-containing protein [Limosilactobacillus reuteri]